MTTYKIYHVKNCVYTPISNSMPYYDAIDFLNQKTDNFTKFIDSTSSEYFYMRPDIMPCGV